MACAARLTATAVTALLAAALAAPAQAAALRADFTPRATSGASISQGADGTERTLQCPPDENVLGGGFTVFAPAGRTLAATPSDVLASRATADATGWIVAVRKSLNPTRHAAAGPADLILQVVCTEGETSPGA
jgi:hypothetical protein